MTEKTKGLLKGIVEVINKVRCNNSITPEETVSALRKIATVTTDTADRIEQRIGVSESQSPAHIGAERDTCPKCKGLGEKFSWTDFVYYKCMRCRGHGQV